MYQFCTKILNKRICKFRKSAGFTLAEVLITLGIIGIVAEITIPTLMQNIQDQQFAGLLKSSYSDIAGATSRILTENSGTMWDSSSSDLTQDSLNMKEAYKQYFKYVVEGTTNTILTQDLVAYKNSATSLINRTDTSRYGLILANGVYYYFYSTQNCSIPYPNSACRYGGFVIDVNGNQKPNMFGKDVYAIQIVKDANNNFKTVPAGLSTNDYCDPTQSATDAHASYGCTELVIEGKPLP